jgi:protein involved in polysaccharide export with SLBB domain
VRVFEGVEQERRRKSSRRRPALSLSAEVRTVNRLLVIRKNHCALCILILFALLGCSQKNAPVITNGVVPAHLEQSLEEGCSKEYHLHAGDVIEVKFFYNPDLNEKTTIRPDGKISLVGIGIVDAATLTPAALEDVLRTRYSARLRYPDLSVIVREFSAQKVYVGGEVGTPGIILVNGKITALQSILQAGGFKKTGELRNVVVLRNQGTSVPLFFTLNLAEDLAGKGIHNDAPLEPYDVVFVPKTTIAKLDDFTEQYFDKLIPISKSIGFTWVYDVSRLLVP